MIKNNEEKEFDKSDDDDNDFSYQSEVNKEVSTKDLLERLKVLFIIFLEFRKFTN